MRSIADTGMLLISTNEFEIPSAKALDPTRRPLISTKVASGPKPRKLIDAPPLAVESWLLPRVENAPEPFAGIRSSNCCRLSKPMLAISSLFSD